MCSRCTLDGADSSVVDILAEVADERGHQDAKWGVQNHDDVATYATLDTEPHEDVLQAIRRYYGLPSQAAAKAITDGEAEHEPEGSSWVAITLEEFVEAVEEFAIGDVEKGRAELVQLAAVVTQWIEHIDRRSA